MFRALSVFALLASEAATLPYAVTGKNGGKKLLHFLTPPPAMVEDGATGAWHMIGVCAQALSAFAWPGTWLWAWRREITVRRKGLFVPEYLRESLISDGKQSFRNRCKVRTARKKKELSITAIRRHVGAAMWVFSRES